MPLRLLNAQMALVESTLCQSWAGRFLAALKPRSYIGPTQPGATPRRGQLAFPPPLPTLPSPTLFLFKVDIPSPFTLKLSSLPTFRIGKETPVN